MTTSQSAPSLPAGTPAAGATPVDTAGLARLDAAIEAADPQSLVTPVLGCINAKMSQETTGLLAALDSTHPQTFYGGVATIARGCGVTVVVQLGPGSTIKFIA